MNSIFNPPDYAELNSRLALLTPESQRQWGTMSVEQMLVHCRKAMETAVGDRKLNTNLILKMFGKAIKKKMFSAPRFAKNAPTAPQYKVGADEAEAFQTELKRLADMIARFEKGPDVIPNKKHPVFGLMTDEEWGRLHYMHLDHHFRQFGV